MSQRERRANVLWLSAISLALAFVAYFYSSAFVRIETKALALVLAAPANTVVQIAAAYVPSILGTPALTCLALIAQFVTYFFVVAVVRMGYQWLTKRNDS